MYALQILYDLLLKENLPTTQKGKAWNMTFWRKMVKGHQSFAIV